MEEVGALVSSDGSSYPFTFWSGLLTQEHRARLGAAVWEFLWCIDKTTEEYTDNQGTSWGRVWGCRRAVRADDLAGDLGSHPKTVATNLKRLSDEGYIRVRRVPRGWLIEVHNSKKWAANRPQSDGAKTLHHEDPRGSENTLSPPSDGAKTLLQTSVWQSENTPSHKTDQEDKASWLATERGSENTPSQPDVGEGLLSQVERLYSTLARTNAIGSEDYRAMEDALKATGGDVPLIETVMRSRAAGFHPRHQRDKIRSFKYFLPAILDEVVKREARQGALEVAATSRKGKGTRSRAAAQSEHPGKRKYDDLIRGPEAPPDKRKYDDLIEG